MPEYSGTAKITLDDEQRPVRLEINITIEDGNPIDAEKLVAAMEKVGASAKLSRVYVPKRKKKSATIDAPRPEGPLHE